MEQNQKLLSLCEAPWVVKCDEIIPESILRDAIILDGLNMSSSEEFHDEISKKFNFPYYGKNNNALRDNLTDLSWLPKDRYVVVIKSAEAILSKEVCEILDGFFEVLSDVAEEWSISVEQGEEWDRPSIPFHTVMLIPENFNAEFSRSIPVINFLTSSKNGPPIID
ncbi:MAG TPA: barstar family protein [Candidatus Scalindua sp.]|nr:barstar family protein [Candidatus Scalindua sp.]